MGLVDFNVSMNLLRSTVLERLGGGRAARQRERREFPSSSENVPEDTHRATNLYPCFVSTLLSPKSHE
jgi:hypothetical protein